MIVILIKLIAAHLVGDFYLQSKWMCDMKFGSDVVRKIESLTIHSLIVAVLSYWFVGYWDCWKVPLIIFVTHFVIDFFKGYHHKDNLTVFLIDQVAHFIVLFFVWYVFILSGNQTAYASDNLLSQFFWVVAISFLFVLTPTSLLIKRFMEYERWIPDGQMGLPNAGKWIGYLERILILVFVLSGNIDGIGFLLAAKSIFRFGELNKAKDVKITEYVLIGTFASFTIAILVGFFANWLLSFGC